MTSATSEAIVRLEAAHNRRRGLVLGSLGALLFVSIVTSMSIGASGIPWLHVVDALLSKIGISLGFATPGDVSVIWAIRMPRAVFAVISGASLALSGVLVQSVFRNPLAAPDVIGTTGGAAVGAALALTIIPVTAGPLLAVFGVPALAFVCAALATFLVLRASEIDGRPSAVLMLLVGIAINSFTGAFVGLVTALSSDTRMRSITSWMLGSVAGSNWTQVAIIAITTAIGAFVIFRKMRTLDAIAAGEVEAWAAGIDVAKEKRVTVALAALLCGTIVSISGMIGFISLVVPHLMRLVLGASHRDIIPASLLGGATLFLISDTVARIIIAPKELPVGVITAFIGAPIFVWLLYQGARKRAAWLS